MTAVAPAALSPRQQTEDFDAMWRAIEAGYAYFDPGRGAWKRVRETWRPRASRAQSRADFVAALQGAVNELRDDHVTLSERSAALPRRIPFDIDIWPRWKDGSAVIEAVRTFGDADVAGLRPGLVVTRVRGVAVERAVRELLGSASTGAAARDWALRQVLAGPRLGLQRIEVRDGSRISTRERERRGQPRVADTVAPRGGAPYRAPVVVLVDRWTAGEGEALAAGLNAVARAKLVGTPMAGLRGELRETTLHHSGITVRFPAEKSFHVNGEPRESLRPTVGVDLAAPSGGPGDPILYQALKILEK